MKKALTKELEFVVEIPKSNGKQIEDPPKDFEFTSETVKSANPKQQAQIPPFQIVGKLHRTRFPINQPFTGELNVKSSTLAIRSIELQLVRVETVLSEGKSSKEATEIQNIQICEGDICRDLVVPIYMVFPRLYACPTVECTHFKTDFEVNMIVVFSDGFLVVENFPIIITREI